MESYDNEQAGAAMQDGMRRTVIPGLKRESHYTAEQSATSPDKADQAAETRRFTPSPLQQQNLRSVRLPQTEAKAMPAKYIGEQPRRISPEPVTSKELFSRVKDQDTMRRLAAKVGNDLDEELASNQQWRENLADLTQKQPLNPQVPTAMNQPERVETEPVQQTAAPEPERVDPAAQALAKAREDAFRMWEAQTTANSRENEQVQPENNVDAPNYRAIHYAPDNNSADNAVNDYEPTSYQAPTYVTTDADNSATPVYVPDDYAPKAETEEANDRFQAYDNLVANPDQAAYAYQAGQYGDYANNMYRPQAMPDMAAKVADMPVETEQPVRQYRQVPNEANYALTEQRVDANMQNNEAQPQEQPDRYDAALANDTGLVGSLLTSGQDLVNLLQTLFTNFPEEACKKIAKAKSMAFVPVALLYFVLQLIYGSARADRGGLLTGYLTGTDGLSVWAALLVTILTAVCHIGLYTLIFMLANYLSYHKQPFMSTLNCVAALLLLQACFIPFYLIFNIFAAAIVSLLRVICFTWSVLLVDKFVRQQGSQKFSKQADLVALIIASLAALMPTFIRLLF